LTVSRRGKNIIGAQLIIGRFGLPCLPAGWRFRSKKNEENKAANIIADIPIEKSIFPSFREAI
jgi:hypothetical protein